MILMTTKYLENLHRDGPLSKYSIAKIPFAPGSPHDFKMPFEQLFWMTPYHYPNDDARPLTEQFSSLGWNLCAVPDKQNTDAPNQKKGTERIDDNIVYGSGLKNTKMAIYMAVMECLIEFLKL